MNDNERRFAALERELLSWPGVSKEPGRFNSVAFKLGRREIGHVHRNGVADFGFPRAIRDELVAAGRATPHQAGVAAAVSFHVRADDDVPRVVELFRLSYDRLHATDRDAGNTSSGAGTD
jgi:hypothetical protein